MKPLSFLILGLLCIGCQKEKPQLEEQVGDLPRETKDECYLYAVGKDSIRLHLQRNGDQLTGRVAFDNFEKDSSEGTVSGRKVGDTIKLVYDFESEGMQSKRELFFLETGGELRMGLGNFEPRDGVSVPLGPLDYRGPIALRVVDCPTDF